MLSYIYIYISIFLIIFNIHRSNFLDFSKYINFLFFVILIYGIFEIFLNVDDNWSYYAKNFYISLFGNVRYGPIFLAPIFFLWAINQKSLNYFEKISFFSVVIGILINSIFFF